MTKFFVLFKASEKFHTGTLILDCEEVVPSANDDCVFYADGIHIEIDEPIIEIIKDRQIPLHCESGRVMEFAKSETYKEREALEYFKGLSPKDRTQKLGEFARWFNDQQTQLEGVRG